MRISRIRFRNLNSLAGEWEIDLTHPAFASDGLFAITGPTGAGKTTLLDAICLALYGRTPRLGRITAGGNEIMSRQTGECFAEATFETRAGRFRCHWEQHRAGRSPAGALQPPRHEIADADSGEILESGVRDAAGRIEAVTGMDFDRFTRSMLLAQGGFAVFLQAAPDERAPILEQITGTGIYSRISIRVHERLREEREKLDLLRAETAGIAVLEPEREEELRQAIEAARKEENLLAARSADTGKAVAWLMAMKALNAEIAALAVEADRLQGAVDAFAPERERLDRAIRAASLEGSHATLAAIRKQQADDRTALKEEKEALPGLESSAGERAESLKSAERRVAHAKEELQAAAPLMRTIRALDQRLFDRNKTIREEDEACRKDAARIDADRRARQKEREKRASAENDLRLAETYLREHARDEWLVGGLAGIEERLGGLRALQKEMARREADREKAARVLEQAARSLAGCRERRDARKRELDGAARALRQGRDELGRLLGGRLLREYRAEKEALLREQAFLARIAELQAHRARLEDGKPCPLCGAIEHPFAAGNVPVPDETERKIGALGELIGKAETLEDLIGKREKTEIAARDGLADSEKREAAAANDAEAAGKALAESKEALEALQAGLAETKLALSARLQPLGIAEIADVSPLFESLKARLAAWQTQTGEKAGIGQRIAALDSEMKRLDAVIETQDAALAEKRKRLENIQREYAGGREERRRAYGDKNPDDEERRLNDAVSAAERDERKARTSRDELRRKLDAAKAHAESLEKSIARRNPELEMAESGFAARIEAAGFADETRFLAARLTAGQRDELSAKARELDDRLTDLKARRQDRETRLAAEIARNLTDQPLEALEARLRDDEAALRQSREALSGLQYRLNENAAARERMKISQAAIEARQKEFRRWENLHALIGSADGKKYRNFAQGLTFEMMIGHANRQLRKMTDRYLLIHDGAAPLELSVIDAWQAGEIRSTKNLSGGECFIVSLALALGLSRMASRNVRVDSLFLDEGFGLLDEETLDTALETLAELRRDGKLIGVISHVPALKERIAAQIEVAPRTGGRSHLSGPGCRRV
ncbi:MAG: AAA family ATPase [Candidatus Accumulibacter sp.]|jgi:exonuclease SbcC|nr:AAA family ATPase [Accumulibacter sp.]